MCIIFFIIFINIVHRQKTDKKRLKKSQENIGRHTRKNLQNRAARNIESEEQRTQRLRNVQSRAYQTNLFYLQRSP